MLEEAKIWELVDLPDGTNLIGSTWVFKVKKDAAGTVRWYKACFVAQGFCQVPGVDYFDTFALVAHLLYIYAVLVLQISFGPISTNSLMIYIVSMALESP